MIRFAGLQVRAQLIVAAVCLLAAAIAATITGPHLAHLYRTDVVPCTTTGSDCGLQLQAFFNHDNFLQNSFDFVIRLVPALIGIFWGAPLFARELETGTFRLAWTQSVSRSRWTVTKLALGAIAATLTAGLFSLIVTWWYRAFDLANGNVHSFSLFDQRGLVAAGYGLFAFAVGALLGAILRRVLPAMAATLAVFVFVRVAVGLWIRPHYMSALHTSASILSGGFGIMARGGSSGPTFVAEPRGLDQNWVLHTQIVDGAGQPVSSAARAAFLQQHCANVLPGGPAAPSPHGFGQHAVMAAPNAAAFHHCQAAAAKVYHALVTYQPSSRFWTFQWIETGLFTALALAVLAACFWWVRRRIA
ncbi:MAG TPA: ABC transporter permease subunit [Mycobacteriales bacterium]|nr:ABC transporter permease subunit [Mycobacteriales bacterium]